MKKLLLSVLMMFLTLWVFGALKQINASANGTRVNGYYILEDFEGYAIDYSYPKSVTELSALVKASPTAPAEKAVLYSMGGSGTSNVYVKISTALPVGKVLADFDSIMLNRYLVSVSYKEFAIWINGTKVHKVQIHGSNLNQGVVKFAFSAFNQAGAATVVANAGNNPEIGIGITDWNNNTSFYIDNVKLSGGGTEEPPANTYTVTLNPGTGTCAFTSLTEAEEGAGVTLPTATPSAKCGVAGYTFAGWAGSAVSETDVEPVMLSAGFWAIPQDTTLYAVYTNDTVFNTSPSCSVSLNGTVTGGFLMVEDFENNDVDDLLTLVAPYPVSATAFAKVVVSPTNAEEQVVQAVTKNWDEYYSITVTLPAGKTLSDYEKLDYDIYYNSISGTDNFYKDFLIRFDAVPGSSSYFYKESTGGTDGHNVWAHRSIDLTGATGGNTFTLNMGIRGNNTNYMFDNIQLKEKPVTATYTVTFNPGAGTCATSSLTESAPSSGVTLPATATPSAQAVGAGWSFYGWSNVAVNSTTVAPSVFAPSSTYYPLVNVTLFAVYTNSTNYNTYPSTATSLNGTVTSRLLMVEDFETQVVGTALNIFNTGGTAPEGTAKISVSPSNLNERAVHFTTEYYNNILQLSVTLPEGKTIANYEQLLFDFYWPTEDHKKMNVYIDGVKIHEDENYISQAPINTWTTKTYNINTTSSNVVVLAFGISTDAGNYYMDNIKLKESFTTSVDAINEKLFSFEGNRIQLKEVGDIRVMDLNGRVLINSNNTKDLDLNMLNNGVYIVKAIVAGNSVVEKVMKR
jgi:hypothetical protein